MGASFGWKEFVGDKGKVLSIDRFGMSAPGNEIIEEYGFDNLYIGKKHFILKEDNENGASLTILFRGVNDLTKFCFDQIM